MPLEMTSWRLGLLNVFQVISDRLYAPITIGSLNWRSGVRLQNPALAFSNAPDSPGMAIRNDGRTL